MRRAHASPCERLAAIWASGGRGGRRRRWCRWRRRGGARAPRISSEHKPFATTEELRAITGLERQSLRLWVRRGLLPKPGYFSDGKHGVRSRWPRSVLDRARFVMAMRAQGHTLDEIAGMIREKWGAEDAGGA